MPKSAKQINAEISGLLTRTGAEPYWPGGDGGGGSGRPRSGRSAVVKPHARTTARCTRCSQYHTTEEHERHAGARSRGQTIARKATKKKMATKKTATKKVKTTRGTAKSRTTKKKAKSRTASARPPIATRTTPSLVSPGVAFTRGQMDRGEADDVGLAARIKSAIRAIGPEGRFGWKVFISEIWKRLRSYDSMSLPEFKTDLLRLNREGLIVLARADLVGAMDPAKVAASEITDRGSSFHFVLDPDETPGY